MFGANPDRGRGSSSRRRGIGDERGNRGNGRGRGNFHGGPLGTPFRGNYQQPGRLNNQRYNNLQHGRTNYGCNDFKQDGIPYKDIEQLCADMDSMKVLSGSSDLLKFVQGKGFSNRLNNIWTEVEKQTKFLRVIVSTASSSQADMLPLTYAFLGEVLSSKLVEAIVDTISPLPYNKQMQQNSIYAELVGYTVKLLLLGFECLPSKMDIHLTKVHVVITTLNGLTTFLSAETIYDLEGLKERIQERYTAKTEENAKEIQERQQNKRKDDNHGAPPDDFRNLSLIPTTEDMDNNNFVYLRPAKIDGKYDSDEHYLDVQFRLLREDLIRPLREGIAGYQGGGAQNSDLFVYRNVSLEPPVMYQQTGELVVYANIQILKRLRMNKRLINGSLICLSSDGFKNEFLFATILDRNNILDAKIGLKFEGSLDLNFKRTYSMVESPAFFDAYRHVMTALKNKIPPNKNILTAQNFQRYLTPAHLGMDQSQFDALANTLQSDLAIIQGPPGTGKTFMGLQIANLLISNPRLWQSVTDKRPILVVCYTNHALDQFLEGISHFLHEGIVRVGGGSKNPNMQQYMIHKLRKWDDLDLKHSSFELRTEIADLQIELEVIAEDLKDLSSRFVHPNDLQPYFRNKNLPYFRSCQSLCTKVNNTETFIMSSWLTSFKLEDDVPFDVKIIQQLMKKRIPEIQAKNALLCTYYSNLEYDSQSIFENLKNGIYGTLSTSQLMEGIEHWPSMRQVNDLVRQGFDANIAAEILISSNNDMQIVYREIGLVQNFLGNRRPVAPQLPNPKEETKEQLTEIDVKADDDNNRIIVDNNFMEEINAKRKKAKKIWYDKNAIKPALEHIVNTPGMTNEEAQNITDIWQLPLQTRWRLYQRWISQSRNKLKGQLKRIEEKYSEKVKEHQALKTMVDVEVMKKAKVVGMTTTGAAKHQSTLRTLRSRIVIIEEAAEVLEAHVVASLTIACEHLILIGDHKQLRPNPAVYELAKKYNMDISLFERLVKNGFPYRMLSNQHRMCTDISRTLMPHFYDSLHDHPSVLKRESVIGVTKNLMFITHSEPEISEKDFKSHNNPFEAKYALKLAKYFLQQGYKSHQITVLCTYLDQLLSLRKASPNIIGELEKITIESVDNYQGEESDIVILSLVRSNNPEGKIGFLNIPNRVCVALSRARMGLYVICNLDFLSARSEMWKNIQKGAEEVGALDDSLTVECKMHRKQQLITRGEDFDEKCPEGGCDDPCNTRLNCGHMCPKPCHAEDMNHLETKCLKPCARTCSSEHKHRCKKRCHQECGSCIVLVEKQLPCSHTKMDQCYLKPEHVRCVEPCQKSLPCNHPCTNFCGATCTKQCAVLVKRKLPGCEHIVTMKCSDDPSTVKCKEVVLKKWPICNHTVNVYCFVDVLQYLCPKPCNAVLPGCGHLCKGRCGDCRNGRLHIRCNEKCKKILICGHECESKCSNSCPPCQKLCQTACAHSQCGKLSAFGENPKKVRQKAGKKCDKSPTGNRLCGDPCPPCVEKCLNRCPHRICDNNCNDPCNVVPCNEPCNKVLSCSPKKHQLVAYEEEKDDADSSSSAEEDEDDEHYCIGVCGEECLEICKICDSEKYEEIQEVFFGTEEEEDAKYIQLKDCGHIFEVSGLDQWVKSKLPNNDSNTIEIVEILCPRCKTPIRRSKRYISLLNQRSVDIEQIKLQIRGLTVAEKKDEQKKFSEELNIIIPEVLLVKQLLELRGHALGQLKPLVGQELPATTTEQSSLHYCDAIKNGFQITDFSKYLSKEIINLIFRIDVKETSETIIQQLSNEVSRYGFLCNVFVYMNQLYKAKNDLDHENANALYKILGSSFGSIEFKGDHETKIWEDFKAIVEAHPAEGFGISEKERIEIVKALDGAVTKWYKCPNGHMYGIGECGQAMVKTKCPECGTVIGGQNHQLQAGNSDATAQMRQGLAPLHIPDPFVVREGPEW
uniref:RZ-type domain-containing protein n=1 Tax=Panagrolaimus superbus TaxID=310955 RepID=A0A914YV12_9BILA